MRTLSGKKLKIVKAGTKREVFMLNGQEITRQHATQLAIDTLTPGSLNEVMKVVAFRDCGTRENPSQTSFGPLWREYREIGL